MFIQCQKIFDAIGKAFKTKVNITQPMYMQIYLFSHDPFHLEAILQSPVFYSLPVRTFGVWAITTHNNDLTYSVHLHMGY